MCTVLLSPGDSPIAVNKYIIIIIIKLQLAAAVYCLTYVDAKYRGWRRILTNEFIALLPPFLEMSL